MSEIFTVQQFADGAPPDGGGGTPPDGEGGGGSSSSTVTYSGATEITAAGTYSNQTYTSSTADENSVLVSLASGTVNLVNATVTKSGDSDGGDNCNFYGINSAVLATGGGTVSIVGGNITATAKGANGVFSYGGNGGTNGAAGDGTTIYISDATIKTTGDNGGGIMTTGGGVTVAKNLTITTTGQSSAPIRTDRGGGNVTVSGGSYTSSGLGSPAVYCTADIVVEDATLTSNLSEGVCIEGQNSVALTDCTLTASNTQTNGNAQFLDAVILYQSQSGDAADGTSTFSMTGGTLINTSGHLFHVTNTTAVINLDDVTINDSGDGILLSVCDDGWSGASNIATLNAVDQELTGDILVGDDSTLTLNLTDGTIFTGTIDGNITNAAGTSISTDIGTVNVALDADSKWYLTADTYVSTFSGTVANIISNGYTFYVNNVALDGTTESDDDDDTTLTLTNSDSSPYEIDDDVKVVDASSRTKAIQIAGNSLDNSITGGSGADKIYSRAGDDTVYGGAGNDSLFGGVGDDVLDGGAGNDTLKGGDGNDRFVYSAGNDVVFDYVTGDDVIKFSADISSASNVFIDGGAGKDGITNVGNNVTIRGGLHNDRINNIGNNVVFEYGTGDGDDIIYGFNETSTLIMAGEYSTVEAFDDIIVKVGDDELTLSNAGKLSTVNIVGGTLKSDGGVVTLDGNDTIANTGANASIDAGKGHDVITNDDGGSGAKIFGGKGNETIDNYAATVNIDAGPGNDYVYNVGSNVTIETGLGTDEVKNSGSDVMISTGKSNDIVYTTGANVSVFAGDGVNYIVNDGANGYLVGGEKADIITNTGANTTMNGGNGTNELNNYGDGSRIIGGEKYDNITNVGDGAVIYANKGEDHIVNYGDNVIFRYASGDGNDIVHGFNSSSQLQISGSYSTIQRGKDIVVQVGNDTICLSNAASLESPNIVKVNAGTIETMTSYFSDLSEGVTISNADSDVTLEGTVYDDSITSTGSHVLIMSRDGQDTVVNRGYDGYVYALGGDDVIENRGDSSFANGGEGNDTITNVDGAINSILWGSTGDDVIVNNAVQVTINAGTDNDIITNHGARSFLNGDSGNDTINNDANNVTIRSGKGNDTISNSGANLVIIHTNDGGNDYITGFNDTSTLKVAAKFSTQVSGNDVLVKISQNTVTLAGAASLGNVNIVRDTREYYFMAESADFTVGDVTLDELMTDDAVNAISSAEFGVKNNFDGDSAAKSDITVSFAGA